MTVVNPPLPSSSPQLPSLLKWIDLTLRDELDPELIFSGLAGDGGFTLTGWTPTEIQGLWGLANYFAWLAYHTRSGTWLDPSDCMPEMVDRIALHRGLPGAIIEAIRSSETPDDADSLIRKLGALAPQLFRFKSSRAGGGTGGIERALRVFARYRVVTRENFYWKRTLADGLTTQPIDGIIGRDLSIFHDPADSYIFDLFVVDWPTSSILIASAVEELIDLIRPASETAYLHLVRWVDDFRDADPFVDGDWITERHDAADLWAVVTSSQLFQSLNLGDPFRPGGRLEVTKGAAGAATRAYPRTASIFASGQVQSHDHFVDLVVQAKQPAAGHSFDIDVNADLGGEAYRVRLNDSGTVELYYDNFGAPVTLRASAVLAFLPGIFFGDGIRATVQITRATGPATKTIKIWIDGVLVITDTDAAQLQNTLGAFWLEVPSFGASFIVHRILWADPKTAPTILAPG